MRVRDQREQEMTRSEVDDQAADEVDQEHPDGESDTCLRACSPVAR